MDRYKALALQVTCQAVNKATNRMEAEAIMMESIQRITGQIMASKKFIGPDTKLVVLPEYFLTGFPMRESMQEWKDKACLPIDGKIYKALGQMAQTADVYLSGNAYEIDPHFSSIYFQTSFIIDPNGEVILRYRRLNSMYAPTPHDVWDKYLEIYGYEKVFPVVKTDIGNLACIASEEILYPEIARCLMMQGAEIILHASSEAGSPMFTQKNIAKQARAIENMAYVVSANSAGIADIPIPYNSTDGGSKVINYEGLVMAEANIGESMVANATIDLPALRAHRQRVSMSNFIARQRLELYAPAYGRPSFYPPNSISNNPDFVKKDFIKIQQDVINQLRTKGTIH